MINKAILTHNKFKQYCHENPSIHQVTWIYRKAESERSAISFGTILCMYYSAIILIIIETSSPISFHSFYFKANSKYIMLNWLSESGQTNDVGKSDQINGDGSINPTNNDGKGQSSIIVYWMSCLFQ